MYITAARDSCTCLLSRTTSSPLFISMCLCLSVCLSLSLSLLFFLARFTLTDSTSRFFFRSRNLFSLPPSLFFSRFATACYPLHSANATSFGVETRLAFSPHPRANSPVKSLLSRSRLPLGLARRSIGDRRARIHIRASKWRNNIFHSPATFILDTRSARGISALERCTWGMYSVRSHRDRFVRRLSSTRFVSRRIGRRRLCALAGGREMPFAIDVARVIRFY